MLFRFDNLILNERLKSHGEHDSVGSTAVCAFIDKSDIVIANLGDSRAILIADDIKFTTLDHKPKISGERTRIESTGRSVIDKRVCGLNMSRAFGSVANKVKLDENRQPIATLAEVKAVESKPDIDKIPRRSGYRFLVIVSDGVTDALKCAETTIDKIINEQLKLTNDLKKVSTAILNFCLSYCLNCSDNMTLILIALEKLDEKVDEKAVAADAAFEEEIKGQVLRLLESEEVKKKGWQPLDYYRHVRQNLRNPREICFKITFITDIVKKYGRDVLAVDIVYP